MEEQQLTDCTKSHMTSYLSVFVIMLWFLFSTVYSTLVNGSCLIVFYK